MSKKSNGVNHSMRVAVKSRRERVLLKLEAQLKSGVKNTKEGQKDLTENDVKRIKKEIGILKTRI